MYKLKPLLQSIMSTTMLEQHSAAIWYHGTADSTNIERSGGFISRTTVIPYITDVTLYKSFNDRISSAFSDSNKKEYNKLQDELSNLKKDYKYTVPLFVTDNYEVAKTYANGHRAYDFQSANPKVLKVKVRCSKAVEIMARGERFKGIDRTKVVKGFVEYGIPSSDVEEAVDMFTYNRTDGKLSTNVIAAIGNWFKVDCIDVKGVLDSYMGGNIESTVRMVMDPSIVTLHH
jgi:hypothetical protein